MLFQSIARSSLQTSGSQQRPPHPRGSVPLSQGSLHSHPTFLVPLSASLLYFLSYHAITLGKEAAQGRVNVAQVGGVWALREAGRTAS